MNATDSTTADLTIDALPDETTSRHSIFEKTTPELRRKLDRAILSYEPAGYRPLYKKYNLADLGVSFTSFYRHASRLRARAATMQLASEVLPEGAPSLVDILPDLISQHLVEQIMANDAAGADTIYRLTLAHRAALENAALARKHRAAGARIPSRTHSDGNPFPSASPTAPSEPPPPSRRVAEETGTELSTSTVHAPPPRPNSAPQSLASVIPVSLLPNPLASRIDVADLPDPDPRREALRQRIREDLTPLLNINNSS